MQINKIQGNMNFGLTNSKQYKKYERDPRSTKNVSMPNEMNPSASQRPFYKLTKKENLPAELKSQLSNDTIKYIEGILHDIKTDSDNPNITTVLPHETVGGALERSISRLLKK